MEAWAAAGYDFAAPGSPSRVQAEAATAGRQTPSLVEVVPGLLHTDIA